MAYIAPIHTAGSVRHACYLSLLEADRQCLVVAKANLLEIWKLDESDEDGQQRLTQVHSQSIHGTITMLQKLNPRDSPTDLLFVGTDRFQYFTSRWDPATARLETVNSFNDTGEKYMRDSQSQDRCVVDPTGKYMAMFLWEGVLNVLRLNARGNTKELRWMDQVRLSELFIKSATFLHSETGHPKIAFLYQTRADMSDTKLVTYRLTSDDRDQKPSEFDRKARILEPMDMPDSGATLMIPVEKVEKEKRHNIRNPTMAKPQLGGLLIVGETRLLYIDDMNRQSVKSTLKTPCIFVTWARRDATHYILGDDYGALHLLSIMVENDVEVTSMKMNKIGTTSRASQLVYLGNDMLFVAAHYGDSQLYRLNFEATDRNFATLVQSMSNIGPILDFTVMDMGHKEEDKQLASEYSSGQAKLVTGSGVHRDGSLRSVRSGVGMEDIGILGDLPNVRRLFSLRSYGGADIHGPVDTLVASFYNETRVFKFDLTGEVEEVEAFGGLSLSCRTLLITQLPNSRILQVTSQNAVILDAERDVAVAIWRPSGGMIISDASANSKWLLLSVGGTKLVSFDITQDQLAVSAEKSVSETDGDQGNQVACINASPRLLDVGAVGFWASGSVSIIDLATLKPRHGGELRRSKDNISVPRDIVLTQVLPPGIGGPTLLVAMDDGNVVTFDVSKTDLELSGRKSVTLGSQQASFQVLPQPNGTDNILATTEHPSLIYGAEGRIVYAAVTAEDVTCACPFDTEAFPGAVAVATDSEIKLSRIDTARRPHVTTLPMGETIRRIAYSPTERVFGLGCLKRELKKDVEIITSSFKLVDEVVFSQLGKTLEINSPGGIEMVECVVRMELPDAYGNPAERFIVGTSFDANGAVANKSEEKRGRILVIGVDSDRNPFLLMSHNLKGACRCVALLGENKIVAGLSKTVVLSQYEELSSTEARLTRLASYRPATYPMDVAVHGNMIAVADLMKSLAIVEYLPPVSEMEEDEDSSDDKGKAPEKSKKREIQKGEDEHRLIERCRHFQAAWTTSVCHLEGDSWLQADAQGNVQVLERNTQGVTAEDRRKMDCMSEINLGEQVNKIRPIAVESSPNAMIIPKAFMATVEGSIYLFGTVAKDSQDLLLRFQSRLQSNIQVLGNIDFRTFRAFRNEERLAEEPFRFLDGELLERFLDMNEETQKTVCEGLGPDVETMRGIVEELKRLHS